MAESLQIVVLGSPGAGKTSLLGALACCQDEAARGPLAEVCRATYGKGPAPTKGEGHRIAVDVGAAAGAGSAKAVIRDSSGDAAQALVAGKAPLDAAGPLAQEVLGADAVLLVVDASASSVELDRDFQQLGSFLRRLLESRSRRAEIAGLPVYIVLSKCDLLAKPTDTQGQWMQRIEERKQAVSEHFRSFAREQKSLPFGAVDLHFWAAAIKRPKLADQAARAQEPYLVAELFRQVVGSARSFERARDQASGVLSLAVLGTFSFLGLLGIVAALFFMLRPSAGLVDLENQVQTVLSGSSAAERLREPLDERLKELAKIQANPYFAQLPEKTRQDVVAAQEEIERYQELSKELLAKIPDPRFATRPEELVEISKKLAAFELPADYAQAWSETKLAKRLAQWKLDTVTLQEAAAAEEKWLREQVAEAQALKKQGGLVIAKTLPAGERDDWFVRVKEHLDRDLRKKRSDRVAPGSSLTYDHIYKYQPVDQARKQWEQAKESLKEVRRLAQ